LHPDKTRVGAEYMSAECTFDTGGTTSALARDVGKQMLWFHSN